jgi:hypothetical protein
MSRYTCIRYDDRDIYLEEPVPTLSLHPQRVEVIEDGMRLDELPEDANPICVDDLPQGVWADYADTSERDGRDYADHESAQWVRSLTE